MNHENFELIVVSTTSDDKSILDQIAKSLVIQNLAACVQISGPITSFYQWQGNLEKSTEWQCTIKTSKSRFAEVERTICQLHNYETPQLIAVPIVDGNPDYLEWLESNLADPHR